jgi:hypothetical protein
MSSLKRKSKNSCVVCKKDSCRLCQGCHEKRASYGDDKVINIRCSSCKLETDVSNKPKCEKCKSGNRSYGKLNESAKHCKKCAEPGDINLSLKYHDKCKECDVIANYGLQSGVAEYCTTHKSKDMIDLKNKKCIICNIRTANYKKQGSNKIEYCATCTPTMDKTLATVQYCITCTIVVATFNLPGEHAKYCVAHKLENMIDVRSKKCIVCNKKQPSYGQNDKIERCFNCKVEQDICMKNSCTTCNKKQASFSTDSIEGIRCFECKLSTDANVKINSFECITCKEFSCYSINVNCYICNIELEKISGISSMKYEKDIAYTLKQFVKNKNLTITFNKCIGSSGEKYASKRPDILINCNTFYIIVEVDENQHKTYINEKERMDDIIKNLDGPVFFIRYNTSYYTRENIKLDTFIDERKGKLLSLISSICKTQLENSLIVYLFYDEIDINFPDDNIQSNDEKNKDIQMWSLEKYFKNTQLRSTSRYVIAYDKNGKCCGKFNSINQAAIKMKMDDSSIGKVLDNENRFSCDLKWKSIATKEEYDNIHLEYDITKNPELNIEPKLYQKKCNGVCKLILPISDFSDKRNVCKKCRSASNKTNIEKKKLNVTPKCNICNIEKLNIYMCKDRNKCLECYNKKNINKQQRSFCSICNQTKDKNNMCIDRNQCLECYNKKRRKVV